MTLTARLVLEPSRRITWIERAMPLLGVAVATGTLVARWPGAAAALLACASISAVLLLVADRRRVAAPWTIDVSDRPDIGVAADGAAGSAHIVESTVLWPGFALVALARTDGAGPVHRRAVVLDELSTRDRRALARFLTWSLSTRGGRSGDSDLRT